MNINNRRSETLLIRDLPLSVLSGSPRPLRRCDSLGCEDHATHHCSGHGVHFCRRHFDSHRSDWHVVTWEAPLQVGNA
jgi:hypothetical protein